MKNVVWSIEPVWAALESVEGEDGEDELERNLGYPDERLCPDQDPLWPFDDAEYRLDEARRDVSAFLELSVTIMRRLRWLESLEVRISGVLGDEEGENVDIDVSPTLEHLKQLQFPLLNTLTLAPGEYGEPENIDMSPFRQFLECQSLRKLDLTAPLLLSSNGTIPSLAHLLLSNGEDNWSPLALHAFQLLATCTKTIKTLQVDASECDGRHLDLGRMIYRKPYPAASIHHLPICAHLVAMTLQGCSLENEYTGGDYSKFWQDFFGRFPSLASLELRGPVFHDGSFPNFVEALSSSTVNMKNLSIDQVAPQDSDHVKRLCQTRSISHIQIDISMYKGYTYTPEEQQLWDGGKGQECTTLFDQDFADRMPSEQHIQVVLKPGQTASGIFKFDLRQGSIVISNPQQDELKALQNTMKHVSADNGMTAHVSRSHC